MAAHTAFSPNSDNDDDDNSSNNKNKNKKCILMVHVCDHMRYKWKKVHDLI